MSMKNSSHTIGIRTRDLLACSAVPQPSALPRAPYYVIYIFIYLLSQQFGCIDSRGVSIKHRKEKAVLEMQLSNSAPKKGSICPFASVYIGKHELSRVL
jgi:hypothetical protein